MPKLKFTVKKGSKVFDKKIKELKKFDKATVEVGHFAAQGNHSKINDSYVDIMKLHHTGGSVGGIPIPERPVMTHLDFEAREFLSSPQVERLLKAGVLTGELDMTLNLIGENLKDRERRIFGDVSKLRPNADTTAINKGRNEPLVDTGELRDKVAHRVSTNKVIIE